jgi:hypothetical protein
MSRITRTLMLAVGLTAVTACATATAPDADRASSSRHARFDGAVAPAGDSTAARGGNLMGSGH